jgi:RNA polymerase sigma-70 factor, ECF subfamily
MSYDEEFGISCEATLVAKLREGEKEAYQLVVKRYYSRLYTCAFSILMNKEDAEDVIQEALAKIFCSIGSFKGDSSLYTWMYRVVHNLSLDYRRKTMRRSGYTVEISDSQDEICAAKSESPDQAFLNKEKVSLFNSALAFLSEDHRSVIILREVDGLSYEEIAEMLNLSSGTVMSRLFYARKNLQKQLEMLGWNKEADVLQSDAALLENSLNIPAGQTNIGSYLFKNA